MRICTILLLGALAAQSKAQDDFGQGYDEVVYEYGEQLPDEEFVEESLGDQTGYFEQYYEQLAEDALYGDDLGYGSEQNYDQPLEYDEEGNMIEHYNSEDADLLLEDEASWVDEDGNEVVEQDWVRNYQDEQGNEVEEHTIIVKTPHSRKGKSTKDKNKASEWSR